MRDTVCTTCDRLNECPGHFGYIPLNLPIYHLGFFNHIIKCLKCLCYVLLRLNNRNVVKSNCIKKK